jgi:hypothetical protein
MANLVYCNDNLLLKNNYHFALSNTPTRNPTVCNVTWPVTNLLALPSNGKQCRLSMPGYIDNLLLKFKHPHPLKPQLSPYTCLPISYGTKTQFLPDEDISELLDNSHKHRIQEIIGSLLYYACAVDNKLLVALSAIAAKQSKATVATEQAVHLLLDYVATYPNDGIIYRASNMILCAHVNAGFLN